MKTACFRQTQVRAKAGEPLTTEAAAPVAFCLLKNKPISLRLSCKRSGPPARSEV